MSPGSDDGEEYSESMAELPERVDELVDEMEHEHERVSDALSEITGDLDSVYAHSSDIGEESVHVESARAVDEHVLEIEEQIMALGDELETRLDNESN